MKKYNSQILTLVLSVFIIGILASCDNRTPRKRYLSDSIPEIDKTREARMLTAFLGLDIDLPPHSRLIDKKAPGKDGMPLVFSLERDPGTLEAVDFSVTPKNGTVYQVEGASFLPANEAFELRTVLLIGEYGNHPDNPSMTVEMVGDLRSRTGMNFKGTHTEVVSR